MIQGIWRELGPLIVLAHLPEIAGLLLALGACVLLLLRVAWLGRRKRQVRRMS